MEYLEIAHDKCKLTVDDIFDADKELLVSLENYMDIIDIYLSQEEIQRLHDYLGEILKAENDR